MSMHGIARLVFITAALLATVLAQGNERTIRLATTTSTENSGLLRILLPVFENESGYRVHVIAAGTGKALRMARDGDVDIVLVHAYDAEQKFIREGHGVNRRDVMYNDFIIVGPRDDPATINRLKDASVALRRIAVSHSRFISRGDDSGTHKKELVLWRTTGIIPSGEWYREVGQGMGKALQMAQELGAYTLTDRGTWLAYLDKISVLQVLVEGDPRLHNRYGIIATNPEKYPDVNYTGAMRLIQWVTSPPGQSLIRDFHIGGRALFVPLAMER